MTAGDEARASARSLPIWDHADDLRRLITDHQVVVVAGETGSGKSTQIPQICLELGRGVAGRIGHTQPRRIAARSVAERIAVELDTSIGERVGYAVRFDDRVASSTQVKVMTDGILLAEIQRDRQLGAYDTLIIDEAHERSLNIDFLLGYLKQLLPRRPDLKVIVTSATIDTARFAAHFDDAPIVEVSGRTHPVEIGYRPLEDQGLPDAIADAVTELWGSTEGDVLVFCSGERDIRDAAEALEAARLPEVDIFPLYARLSSAEQQRVFRDHPRRRVVLATNVAETSLTVPGIRSVVDPGLARISRYSARTKVQRLPIEPISQASADQRAGRCGRVAPGVCLRLYAEEDYDARPEFTEPEITRTNLASVILQMASLGLGRIEQFPFVEPPDRRNIADGIAVLEELGAVDPDREGTRRWMTPLGRELSRLPIDPRLARMVLAAGDEGCVDDVLVIAAALSIQDVRERPSDQREAARQLHDRFADERSDFLSILHLWEHLETERRARSGNQFRKMCRAEFLHHLRIREWQDVHQQLRRVARELGLPVTSEPIRADRSSPDAVHRALLTGFLSQVGTRKTDDGPSARSGGTRRRSRRPTYVGTRNSTFILAPGSPVAATGPKWVMAAELVETEQLRARTVAAIDPRWLESLGSHLMRWSYTGAAWDAAQGAAFVIERGTLLGLSVVAGRRILLDQVNPELARELFIQHALVDPEWPDEASTAVDRFIETDVLIANAETVQTADDLQARTRRRDLVAGSEARFEFYDRRLPDDVTTAKRFNSWWRRERSRQPDLLSLTLADLLPGHEDLDLDDFPDTWGVGGRTLDLNYEFDATSPIDGLIVDVPVDALADLVPEPFTWTVAGFRTEVIEALLRSLPKQVRKEFIPIAETAGELRAELDAAGQERHDRTIVEAVVEHLAVRRGIDRSLLELGPASIPNHLRPTFRVLGAGGEMLAAGKDLGRLQQRMDARARAALETSEHELERSGLTDWPELPDGVLPLSVERMESGHRITAYPAMIDERRLGTGDTVAIRLLATEHEQAVESWHGIRRLLELGLTINRRAISDRLSNRDRLALAVGPYGTEDRWIDDVVTTALDEVIRSAGGPPWDAARFRALDTWAVRRLPDLLSAVADAGVRALRLAAEIETALAEDWPTVAGRSISDIGRQFARLHHAGGLASAGFDRLEHIERYLSAMLFRLERLRLDPGRDGRLMGDLADLEALVDRLPADRRGELSRRLDELRVSLFAQHLGTDGPVSAKRLRRAIAEAERADLPS